MEKSIYSREYALFLTVLRHARDKAGLTQIALAERLGSTQTFISKCERGERRLDFVEVTAWCKALGIETHEFLQELEGTRFMTEHQEH
jgi:transcriptional regulator with XRE-family HTH domain